MPERYRQSNERRRYNDSDRRRYISYEDDYRPRRNDRSYNDDYNRNADRRRYNDYRPASRTSGYSGMQRERNADRANALYHAEDEHRGITKKIVVVFIIFAIIIGNFILFAVLNGAEKKQNSVNTMTEQTDTDNITNIIVSPVDITDIRAQALLESMTTEEKVGQLLLIRSNGRNQQEFTNLISECKVGGVVLFKADFESKTKNGVKDMTSSLQTAAGGKLLICVDEEGGTVVRMSSISELRSEKYKSPQDLYKIGGLEKVRDDTINKCEFLKTYGVNVNFAPVADVVTDSSAFMYKRAFGKNAESTGEYVSEVVKAMKENQVGSSIKHFPGYGNSKGDTHKGLDHNTLSLASLKASDLIPFQYGVAAGADSIMVTHTIIDEVDVENPASMSPECISLIRDYLEFDGVILTDALDMGAIIEFCDGEDPCVQAFCAGIDMLCLPSDPKDAYDNLLNAVNNGKISEDRLDESVKRILKWKIRLGLYDE